VSLISDYINVTYFFCQNVNDLITEYNYLRRLSAWGEGHKDVTKSKLKW